MTQSSSHPMGRTRWGGEFAYLDPWDPELGTTVKSQRRFDLSGDQGPHLVTAAKAWLVGMQFTKSPSYIFPSSEMTKKLVDKKYLSKEIDPMTVSSLPLLPDPLQQPPSARPCWPSGDGKPLRSSSKISHSPIFHNES